VTLYVSGVGDVPIIWMPASDEDYKGEDEGGRSGNRPIAIVHHRIVGSLNSADITFAKNDADPATIGSLGRSVSSTFAIGYDSDNNLAIHQYVNVADTPYTNGDCQQDGYGIASRWDGWYGHKDQGGSSDPLKKGIVREPIIKTSIALDKLLLSGNREAMRAAGIHIRDDGTAEALGKIVPGPTTLIDHNDIAGKGKPYCWRPWQADKVGFPRDRYVMELTVVLDLTPFDQADIDAAVKAATLSLNAEILALESTEAALKASVALLQSQLATAEGAAKAAILAAIAGLQTQADAL
jgi:hypothetical protein